MKKKIVVMLLSNVVMMSAYAGNVDMNGSTTVLPAMQLIAEAVHADNPQISVTISGTGSGNGIKAMNDKMTDIAMASRDIKKKEIDLAKSRGITPNRYTVAIDAIVPVVHPENPVKVLSMANLKDIYSGKIKSWKSLGGEDRPIIVINRDSASGTFETWLSLVMQKTRVTPRALVQATSGGVVQTVANNPNAIGYIGYGYLSNKLKGISVDGLKVSPEIVKKGQWPLSRDLYLFTNGRATGDTKYVVDYALGHKGQALVQKAGYVPVK